MVNLAGSEGWRSLLGQQALDDLQGGHLLTEPRVAVVAAYVPLLATGGTVGAAGTGLAGSHGGRVEHGLDLRQRGRHHQGRGPHEAGEVRLEAPHVGVARAAHLAGVLEHDARRVVVRAEVAARVALGGRREQTRRAAGPGRVAVRVVVEHGRAVHVDALGVAERDLVDLLAVVAAIGSVEDVEVRGDEAHRLGPVPDL